MKLLWGLAQSGVVLLDEVPSNLILRKVIARSVSTGGISGTRGSWVLLSSALVLLLLSEAAIGRHRSEDFGR